MYGCYINKRFIYVGSTNGKIFIFKKEDACLFSPVVLADVITNVESGVITKVRVKRRGPFARTDTEKPMVLFAVYKNFLIPPHIPECTWVHFNLLVLPFFAPSHLQICAVEGLDMLIHGTDQGDVFFLSSKGKSVRLSSRYHKGVISSINYIINEKRHLLYLFVGDLDGVLSCLIYSKKKKKKKKK
ncbi:conserved Plasmodium protein, unknown function [Plasmodium ovale wallikeri]|uniref:Uncharacterized protein n=1 Tax=Plasmodium ovale wallikeri TaxID=864142 RepID=A0A1A8Z2I9_PLAOA|nr:conserved Plasmodium protein, unknown function [Plasmodium ovale wallikeri]